MSLEMTICNGMRTQWNPLINLSLVHTGISPSRKLIPLLSSVAYSSHYSITSGKVDLIKHKPTVSACESLSVYDLRQPQQCSLVEFIIFVNIILPGSINPNILFRNGIVFLAYFVYLSTRTKRPSLHSLITLLKRERFTLGPGCLAVDDATTICTMEKPKDLQRWSVVFQYPF